MSDCGELTGEEAQNIGTGKKEADSTGDAYEDFPEDEAQEFKDTELLTIVTKLKEFGNTAFKSGDFNLALSKYQKGIRYLNEDSEDTSKEVAENLKKIRFTHCSNSALLHIKLSAFSEANASADQALNIKEDLVSKQDRAKAFYRKALALLGLKDEEEAIKNLEKAQELAPGDAAIVKSLQDAKKKVTEQAKKEKAAYSKFFS